MVRISERATYRQNLPVDAEERRKHALLEDTSVSTPLQAEPLAMLLEVKGEGSDRPHGTPETCSVGGEEAWTTQAPVLAPWHARK